MKLEVSSVHQICVQHAPMILRVCAKGRFLSRNAHVPTGVPDIPSDAPGGGQHPPDIIGQDGRTFWLKLKYGF